MHLRRELGRRLGALALTAAALAATAPGTGAADTAGGAGTAGVAHRPGWRLVAAEGFGRPLHVDAAPWVRDPLGPNSPWAVDAFDDDGAAFRAMSDPDFSAQLATLDIYRKRVAFGERGWLTAEIAAVDSDRDGRPDSNPGLSTVHVPGHGRAARIDQPSWDAGVLIRPTRPLPPRYRVEMTLRAIDFGGTRDGSFSYDGKFNGYRPTGCKTSYPWTFTGALPGTARCDYPDVTRFNGFYYLTILDHANPAPHGNPGIHYRRKVIMDGYYTATQNPYGTCNPATGQIYGTPDSSANGVNAIFARGDRFRNNNVSNEYYFKTACGEFDGTKPFGPDGRYRGILTSAELQPELLPAAEYRFAVERDGSGYTIEMSGPFRFVGQTTLRFRHEFVEDGRPIWHHNNTPDAYGGEFDTSLTSTGPSGEYRTEHTWPAGSAYPDTFIIGDPHLNFYEGSAVVDDIRLYVPRR
ncbi:hypothetical protein SAMN05421810_103106 [Amycolatopsis arida]|uniref:Uncharacterized protein n=1 Tax=Amycolatopsis arida TaxID=587909 RepID=A0A1I5SEE9_9PSEU|nr:hypothetical protein [Amycolatopsis arida]TDX96509.1 hypothetical protein CLV69_103652 [Amycolatopsis arida]SFP68857.1 hypothetical protein SAMN05421810_103106 [Amycolatopsis arida]